MYIILQCDNIQLHVIENVHVYMHVNACSDTVARPSIAELNINVDKGARSSDSQLNSINVSSFFLYIVK